VTKGFTIEMEFLKCKAWVDRGQLEFMKKKSPGEGQELTMYLTHIILTKATNW